METTEFEVQGEYRVRGTFYWAWQTWMPCADEARAHVAYANGLRLLKDNKDNMGYTGFRALRIVKREVTTTILNTMKENA